VRSGRGAGPGAPQNTCPALRQGDRRPGDLDRADSRHTTSTLFVTNAGPGMLWQKSPTSRRSSTRRRWPPWRSSRQGRWTCRAPSWRNRRSDGRASPSQGSASSASEVLPPGAALQRVASVRHDTPCRPGLRHDRLRSGSPACSPTDRRRRGSRLRRSPRRSSPAEPGRAPPAGGGGAAAWIEPRPSRSPPGARGRPCISSRQTGRVRKPGVRGPDRRPSSGPPLGRPCRRPVAHGPSAGPWPSRMRLRGRAGAWGA